MIESEPSVGSPLRSSEPQPSTDEPTVSVCGVDIATSIVRPYTVPSSLELDGVAFDRRCGFMYIDPTVAAEFRAFFFRALALALTGNIYGTGTWLLAVLNIYVGFKTFRIVVGIVVLGLMAVDIFIHVLKPVTPFWGTIRHGLSITVLLVLAPSTSLFLFYADTHCDDAFHFDTTALGRTNFSNARLSEICVQGIQTYSISALVAALVGSMLHPIAHGLLAALIVLLTYLGRLFAPEVAESAGDLTPKILFSVCAAATSTAIAVFRWKSAMDAFEKTLNVEAQRREAARRADEIGGLLRTVVPPAVLPRLAAGGPAQFKVDAVSSASVFFADMKGFTAWASSRSARVVATMLNTVVAAVDRLEVSLPSVAKVKTIGDAYWAVCGIPSAVEDHADQLVLFGHGMAQIVHSIALQNPQWGDIQWRIGIHSGPLEGALFGSRQVSYEVFGPTAKIAERVESNGVPGSVCVTRVTLASLLIPLEPEKYRMVSSFNTDESKTVEVFELTPSPSDNETVDAVVQRVLHSIADGVGGDLHGGFVFGRRGSHAYAASGSGRSEEIPASARLSDIAPSVRSALRRSSRGSRLSSHVGSMTGSSSDTARPVLSSQPSGMGVRNSEIALNAGTDEISQEHVHDHDDQQDHPKSAPRERALKYTQLSLPPVGSVDQNVRSAGLQDQDRGRGASRPASDMILPGECISMEDVSAGDCDGVCVGPNSTAHNFVAEADADADAADADAIDKDACHDGDHATEGTCDEAPFEIGAKKHRFLPWFRDLDAEKRFKALCRETTRPTCFAMVFGCVAMHVVILSAGFLQTDPCLSVPGLCLQICGIGFCAAACVVIFTLVPSSPNDQRDLTKPEKVQNQSLQVHGVDAHRSPVLTNSLLPASLVLACVGNALCLVGTGVSSRSGCGLGHDVLFYQMATSLAMSQCAGPLSWPLLSAMILLTTSPAELVLSWLHKPLPIGSFVVGPLLVLYTVFNSLLTEMTLRSRFVEAELSTRAEAQVAALGAERHGLLQRLVPEHVVADLIQWFGTDLDPASSIVREYDSVVVGFIQLLAPPTMAQTFAFSANASDREDVQDMKQISSDDTAVKRSTAWLPHAHALVDDELIVCAAAQAHRREGQIGVSRASISDAHHVLEAMEADAVQRFPRGQALDKIKTVGDTVMVAGPFVDGFTPRDAADAALALVTLTSRTTTLKVGLHVGPVVGTVQGLTRLAFDTFGDSVNVASRVMASSSVDGAVSASVQFTKLYEGHTQTSQQQQSSSSGHGGGSSKAVLCRKAHFGLPETVTAKGKGDVVVRRLEAFPEVTLDADEV